MATRTRPSLACPPSHAPRCGTRSQTKTSEQGHPSASQGASKLGQIRRLPRTARAKVGRRTGWLECAENRRGHGLPRRHVVVGTDPGTAHGVFAPNPLRRHGGRPGTRRAMDSCRMAPLPNRAGRVEATPRGPRPDDACQGSAGHGSPVASSRARGFVGRAEPRTPNHGPHRDPCLGF